MKKWWIWVCFQNLDEVVGIHLISLSLDKQAVLSL